jgi:dipeptidyl aminopeptidase/acylaminoacyl peptidase
METIAAADYPALSFVADPDISPGGERVAFVRRTARDAGTTEATVYVAPVGGGEPRQFTATAGEDAAPRWSPAGDRLAFVSDRGDRERPQLWVMPADGGEARRATGVAGGVGAFAWRPDGSGLAFVQSVTEAEREAGHDLAADPDYEREAPDPRVVDRTVSRTAESDADGARDQVYLVDLGDGVVERLTDGGPDAGCPAFGDADTLFYTVEAGAEPDDSAAVDVRARDLAADETETVLEATGRNVELAATDDRLAYTHTPSGRTTLGQTEIDVYDRTTGEIATVTADLDRTVADLGLAFHPDDALYFATPEPRGVALRRVTEGVETVLGGRRHVEGFSVGADAVAVTQSEWDYPGDVFAATPAGAEEARLTRVNADYLDGRAVREPERVTVESAGHETEGWVLTPPDIEPDREYPLAVLVHGGPHSVRSAGGSMWHEVQTLAARGYVVFWCNPRGSVGRGAAFARAAEGDWGAVAAADVLAGADRVAERPSVDPDAQFVAGGGFGAFVAAWLVGHTDRFRGVVARRGVYDLASFDGATDGADRLVEDEFGVTPRTAPGHPGEQSSAGPGAIETPTLILHGEDDDRAPVCNAELLYRALRKRGVDTRLVRYPREGHELPRRGEPGHVVDQLERTVRWFDGYSPHHDAPAPLARGDGGLSTGPDDTPDK